MTAVEKMCRTARSDNHAALFAMQGYLGLRVSEARAVWPHDVNTDEMVLHVHGKGQKERYVPISDQAWRYMRRAYEQAKREQTTLVNLSDRGARYAVTAAAQAAGIERQVSSHDLRHTRGTDLYGRTKDIRMVQEFLGHSSVVTTQVYTGISMDKMREAMA